MKQLLAIVLALGLTTAYAEPTTKRVCRDVEVKGKTTQQCKTIKIHKKVEGTKVPEKAPAKPAQKNK
jgi:hypothetical protein